MKKICGLVLLSLAGCASPITASRKLAADEPVQIRTAQNRSSGEAAVYVGNAPIQFWPAPQGSFNIATQLDTKELGRLAAFLTGRMADLGGPSDGSSELRVSSVITNGTRTAVRYKQVVVRHRTGEFNYAIPVTGAGVVVNLVNGAVASINSSLDRPLGMGQAFTQDGIDTSAFSDSEYAVLSSQVSHAGNRQVIANRLARLARETGKTFDLQSFLKLPFATQRTELSKFLGGLGPRATARVMIELAQKQRLSYVRRDGHWMFIVSGFFDLPLEFDMEIPETPDQPLKVRNLRGTHQNVTINVFSAQNYPGAPITGLQSMNSDGGKPAPGDGSTTAALFQHTLNYFKRYHNWLNYSGKDPQGQLNIFINVQAPQVADNAVWFPPQKVILISPGGQILKDPQNSYSILGHEFTHGIVMFTSNLVYEGESGALNEHFADIEGSYVAGAANGRNFTYEIGSDALNPQVAAPRAILIQLLIAALKQGGQNVDQAEIDKYSLDKVPVRHLRYPALSITPSINDMATAVQTFGTDCQPSVDNDHCGVHQLSGVVNRAVAEIVDLIGPDRAREMVFNTVTMRLNSHSTFKDYVRQMYEECLITKGLDRDKDCGVVITAFNEVGVSYPVTAPPPVVTQPGPPPLRPDAPTPKPSEPQATPVLDLCGVVTRLPSGNVTIVDNKVNASIVIKLFPKTTQGNFQPIFGWQCACAEGTLSQQANTKGVWFTYFTNIIKVWEDSCKN